MPAHDARQEWDANAAAWIEMSRAGADRYRDLVNTPAFFEMLPDVAGCRLLDVGCGEGHNTRLLVDAGAALTAIDLSETFVHAARDACDAIAHLVGDGLHLPFADSSFDAATAFMCLMDMADPASALRELARVVRPGGFVQFSITHPATTTPLRHWVDDDDGVRTSLAIGRYFDGGSKTDTWTFSKAPAQLRERHAPFTVTSVRLTVADWLNMVADAGMRLEHAVEPRASVAVADEHPDVADTRIVPFFLIIRARV